ncbi:MAG: rhomboid family intramembrane serine protease [Chlorobium sp.]|nr:rhomboid family intramembrane serine protease [Chlorobium sp.]
MDKHRTKSLRQFYTLPLFWALILPVFIGLLKPRLFLYANEIIAFLVLGMPTIIIIKTIADFHLHDKPILSSLFRQLTFVPAGYIYKTDLNTSGTPTVTISLAVINALLFFSWPESLVSQFTFFPHGESSWIQIVLSFAISAFLHADFEHLTGNMIFLVLFGSILENRLGWKRLLAAYFFFILTSKGLTLLLLAMKIATAGHGNFTDYHSLGASGAISGLMGLFVVRCFFARLTISFPFLGLIGVPITISGVMLIGMYFFTFDLIGAKAQLHKSLGVGYWAHVGGYLGGIILGYILKLHVEATTEALTVKARRLKEDTLNRPELTELNKEILEQNPDDEQALLNLFHSSRWQKEKAGEYYLRLMKIYMNSDFPKAVALFTEHYPEYVQILPEAILFKLGVHYYQHYKLNEAAWCLERIVVEHEGQFQEKSMMILGKIYGMLGNLAMSQRMFRRVLSESSDPLFQKEARLLLETEEPV